jgi:hypothetical protein
VCHKRQRSICAKALCSHRARAVQTARRPGPAADFLFQAGALFLAICFFLEPKKTFAALSFARYLQYFGAKIPYLDGICNILGLGPLVGRKLAACWNQHLHNMICMMFTVN